MILLLLKKKKPFLFDFTMLVDIYEKENDKIYYSDAKQM
jgi:hypothetical protein